MKAYEVMLFLMIFNFTLWFMGSIGLSTIGEHDVEPIAPYEGDPDDYNPESSPFLVAIGFGIANLLGIVGTFVVLGWIAGVYNVNVLVISAYVTLFWSSYLLGVNVLFQIANLIPNTAEMVMVRGVTYLGILFIFTGVCAYVFIFGGMQLITGPWGIAK